MKDFDYCTTPTDFKNLSDTIAAHLGYHRDSEIQSDGLFKRQFMAIESITCGIGWKLVIVHKNNVRKDLYPDVGELEYNAFRAFLKGLVIGLTTFKEVDDLVVEEEVSKC